MAFVVTFLTGLQTSYKSTVTILMCLSDKALVMCLDLWNNYHSLMAAIICILASFVTCQANILWTTPLCPNWLLALYSFSWCSFLSPLFFRSFYSLASFKFQICPLSMLSEWLSLFRHETSH